MAKDHNRPNNVVDINVGAKEIFPEAKEEKLDEEGDNKIQGLPKYPLQIPFLAIHHQSNLRAKDCHCGNIVPAKGLIDVIFCEIAKEFHLEEYLS